ncbi:MAG: putative HTH-type transcriptional regulator TtgW [Porticoccaceae bacterium UBA1117]|nr:TetR/AcrR family transcriptional regulator [Porticoccaceae bacterium]CAI8288891.1 MAG: putative HTH-type transcriptional regulator TtgW [Porticoccaceae bacterium UBA1117]
MTQGNTSSSDRIREKKKLFLAREQKVVNAALELLIGENIDRVTVSKIASKAGIGKGTVYKHFLTKNEILVRIMLDYERSIARRLEQALEQAENGDPGAVSKAYFDSRLERPELDRLVQKLEDRLVDADDIRPQLDEFSRIRRSHEDALGSMITKLISEGILEDVPPHYHYLSCWALAQGAVELCFNKSWGHLGDTSALMGFISSIGVTMGNRGQYHQAGDSAPKQRKK